MTFIAVLNPIIKYLLTEKRRGKQEINIEEILTYIQELDNNERTRILEALESDINVK